jgi:ectoine hydroxylase-related dioxygenase (phytanoyl-CoA dioxygenase family)
MTTPASIPAPTPTEDLATAKRDLDRAGYCIIANALTEAQITVARQRLEEQAEAEEELGLSFRDGGPDQNVIGPDGRIVDKAFTAANGGVNQRLWFLVNKGQCFRDMVIHPLVDELVGHVLGSDFILSTHSANIAKPGGVRMGLHTDQWWMPQPMRPNADHVRPADISRAPREEFIHPDPSLGIAPAVVCNTMWMLSDFRADNGATEVVPGSHLTGAHPDPQNQADYPIVQAEAPAGSLMVFDGRLWHGTGANSGTDERLGVLATFCAPQFRQQENQVLGLDRALWDDMPQKLRDRLGFKVWNAYGRLESSAARNVEPEPVRLGELKPAGDHTADGE